LDCIFINYGPGSHPNTEQELIRSRVATLQRNAPNDLAGAGRPQVEALDRLMMIMLEKMKKLKNIDLFLWIKTMF
jgi:hypothetical protein